MADRKISDLTALTAPAAGDYLPIVDISEVSAANKNKRITIEELLRGAPDGTAAAPSIGFESDPNTGIYSPGADALGLVTGGTERARIDSSGRLLVGTSSVTGIPATLNVIGGNNTVLHTQGANADSPFLFLSHARGTGAQTVNPQDGVGAVAFVGYDGTNALTAARIEAFVDGTPGANDMPGRLVFSTTADGAPSPTERMRIDSAGHLGLGATPSAWSGSSARGFNIGTRAVLFNISSGSLFGDNWYFNGTNDIRIEAGYASRIFCNDTGQITTQTTGTSTAGSTITWTQGPYIANGGTSWTNSSDERLKTITGEISDGLNKVSQLRAAEFYWNADENKTQQVGLIAQDLLEVLPQVVVVPETKEKEDDSYGKQSYLGVNYDQVIPLLVAALKESGERIETLEAKVAALEAA